MLRKLALACKVCTTHPCPLFIAKHAQRSARAKRTQKHPARMLSVPEPTVQRMPVHAHCMNASGGGGCSSPRESSATVMAMYASPRMMEMAPVTIAVPCPGLSPPPVCASPSPSCDDGGGCFASASGSGGTSGVSTPTAALTEEGGGCCDSCSGSEGAFESFASSARTRHARACRAGLQHAIVLGGLLGCGAAPPQGTGCVCSTALDAQKLCVPSQWMRADDSNRRALPKTRWMENTADVARLRFGQVKRPPCAACANGTACTAACDKLSV